MVVIFDKISRRLYYVIYVIREIFSTSSFILAKVSLRDEILDVDEKQEVLDEIEYLENLTNDIYEL